MRKRMSRMKKEMAVAVAAAMCISLVGCGGGSSKKVVADKKEAVETTVAETTETETTAEKLTGVNDSEMADILAGTTWAGISSTQEIMVAAFDEKDAYLAILDTDGEVTDLDGYWKADTDTFYKVDGGNDRCVKPPLISERGEGGLCAGTPEPY